MAKVIAPAIMMLHNSVYTHILNEAHHLPENIIFNVGLQHSEVIVNSTNWTNDKQLLISYADGKYIIKHYNCGGITAHQVTANSAKFGLTLTNALHFLASDLDFKEHYKFNFVEGA